MTARKFTSKIKKIVSNPWLLWLYLGSKGLLNWVPDSLYLKGCFRAKMGYPLDLKNPQTFNEKIQWLKLYDRKPEYTQMVDKYAVREYIAKTIGAEYLIPLLGVWDTFDEIDFDQLPDQFVLKCNHDSGTVVICKDKQTFDVDAARKKINARINYNYYYSGREWPYKNVKPKIIAEKYMSQMGCDDLVDYKIMCFNGKAKCEFTCTNRRLETGLNVTFFDLNWNRLPFERHYPVDPNEIDKPNQLSKMISLSEALAIALDTVFVRIDFYEINNQLFFGEFTLYPGAGLEEFTPDIWDKRLGNWLKLPIEE
ncbi:MAG: ATP-grasp fold amidoligase family protein [Atribacterota bacterium]|nr:ATP-grasp fold amidoligase family protein [Atribacterota bacterium]